MKTLRVVATTHRRDSFGDMRHAITHARRRVGASVVKAEAIKKLRCATP